MIWIISPLSFLNCGPIPRVHCPGISIDFFLYFAEDFVDVPLGFPIVSLYYLRLTPGSYSSLCFLHLYIIFLAESFDWKPTVVNCFFVLFHLQMWCCRVNLKFPKIEVRFQNLTVESFVHVGSRALPTIPNFVFNMFEVEFS